MKPATSLRWAIGAATAAATLLAATSAMAQARQFAPGTDCSKVPQNQQVDCDMANKTSTMAPNPTPPLPAGNGTGARQNGTLGPNRSSSQTGGSSSGGNGGASLPGKSTN